MNHLTLVSRPRPAPAQFDILIEIWGRIFTEKLVTFTRTGMKKV